MTTRKQRTNSQRKRPATSASWKPGQSGNPKGRPRSGLALSERIRERMDPDLVLDLADKVAKDKKLKPEQKLNILMPLYDRGYSRPPTEVTATHGVQTPEQQAMLGALALSPNQRRQRIEQLKAEAAKHEAPATSAPDADE